MMFLDKTMFISVVLVLHLLLQLAAPSSCPISISTMGFVSQCPQSEKEWKIRATKKKCEILAGIQNCTSEENFSYHCILNADATKFVEVCAPRWFLTGFCARFSTDDERIINDPGLDCTTFENPCPYRYPSTEAYMYQNCYEVVTGNNTKPSNTYKNIWDHPSLSSPVVWILIVISIALSVALLVITVKFCILKRRRKLTVDHTGDLERTQELLPKQEREGEHTEDLGRTGQLLQIKEREEMTKALRKLIGEEMTKALRNLFGEGSPFQSPFCEEDDSGDEENEDEDERESFQQQSGEEDQCKIPSMSANSGKWDGYYIQFNERHPFSIHLYFGDLDETVKGEGKDDIGDFTINGNWKKSNGSLKFKKQYVGQHDVTYKASIFDDGVKIEGMYKVLGDRGAFFMLNSCLK